VPEVLSSEVMAYWEITPPRNTLESISCWRTRFMQFTHAILTGSISPREYPRKYAVFNQKNVSLEAHNPRHATKGQKKVVLKIQHPHPYASSLPNSLDPLSVS
jgi:hypothetical protein